MIAKMVLAVLVSLLLLCAAIGIVVVAYLWLVWYVSFYEMTRPQPLEDNGKRPKQQGLSEADLQRLPIIDCRNEEEGEERTTGGGKGECAVCLEPFLIGNRCRVIPACRHAFHVHCADAWLSKRSICPICRSSARESDEEKGVIVNVNGGAAQEHEVRNEEPERSHSTATMVVLNAYRG